jgi:hypothetical protein
MSNPPSHVYAAAMVELGVQATSTIIFYSQGRPMKFRRAGWNDMEKFVGPVSRDSVGELITLARAAEKEQSNIITVDF